YGFHKVRLETANLIPAISSAMCGSLLHWILQDSNAFDLDFDHVSGRKRAGVPRRSGVDHVAGHKRYPSADPRNDRRAIEDKVGGRLLLDHLAVQSCLKREVVVVDAGDDGRTKRCERVTSLGAPPLQILTLSMLPVALAHVVAASDTEDGL